MYDIMIVDDDAQLLDMVELILRREGYNVLRAFSGQDALATIAESIPDLFVIDAMMPEMDGLTLCRKLRANPQTAATPIIFLTGSSSGTSVVDALNSGGDDFIRKPFVPRELAARIRAHMRRAARQTDANLPVIRLQPHNYVALVDEREVVLTRVEFDLLRTMCDHPGQLFSTDDLLTTVWRYPSGVGDSALVRNHIHNLRRKVELDPERPQIIQARHGRGYMVKGWVQIESATN